MQRFWEVWGIVVALIGVVLALEATGIWPLLYWPGVALVYFGLLALFVDVVRGKWSRAFWVRLITGLVVFAACIIWTIGFVLANASLDVQASPRIGDYPAGTVLAGITWDDPHYEDLRLYLQNKSDYDFHDLDITLASDLWLTGGAQLETVCPDLQVFEDDDSSPGAKVADATLNGKDKSGNPIAIPLPKPLNLTIPTSMRVRCATFPRHSTISLVVVMESLNRGINGAMPSNVWAPKRLPNWISAKGEYRAIGKTRAINFSEDFP